TEVLALEVDARAPAVLGEAGREVEGRGSPGIVLQERGQPRLEAPVAPGRRVGALELDQRRHQRLRHEAAAVGAEVAEGVGQRGRHAPLRAWATKRRIFSRSFLPGRASTPEFTSTP